MKEDKSKPSITRSLVWIGLLGFPIHYGLSWAMSLISGRPASMGESLTNVLVLLVAVAVLGWLWRREKTPPPRLTDEELQQEFRPALEVVGLGHLKLQGAEGTHVHVGVTRSHVTISDGSLQELSPAAIIWAIRSTSRTCNRQERISGVCLGGAVIVALVLMAWAQRPEVPDGWIGVAMGIIVLGLCMAPALVHNLQLRSDREQFVSREDRLAAKEYLSYLYFSELDKKPFDRTQMNLKSIERQARNLAIALERGYRFDIDEEAELLDRASEPIGEADRPHRAERV